MTITLVILLCGVHTSSSADHKFLAVGKVETVQVLVCFHSCCIVWNIGLSQSECMQDRSMLLPVLCVKASNGASLFQVLIATCHLNNPSLASSLFGHTALSED